MQWLVSIFDKMDEILQCNQAVLTASSFLEDADHIVRRTNDALSIWAIGRQIVALSLGRHVDVVPVTRIAVADFISPRGDRSERRTRFLRKDSVDLDSGRRCKLLLGCRGDQTMSFRAPSVSLRLGAENQSTDREGPEEMAKNSFGHVNCCLLQAQQLQSVALGVKWVVDQR